MIAVIKDNIHVYLTHITDIEDQILWEEFSISKPNAYVDPSIRGNWDGIYRKYNRARKRLARPLLGMLKEVCEKHNLPLEIQDRREAWINDVLKEEEINEDLLPGIKLEDYQIRAIKKCAAEECGIIDLPTGSGKGEIICGICRAISCHTVILADQRVVVDQLKKRLELRDVAGEVGLFYAGKKPNGQLIVVGLIQSLNAPKRKPKIPDRKADESDSEFNRRLKRWDLSYKAYKTRLANVKFLNSYIKKADMIIVDECDKATSESYKSLFRYMFSGRRRYGLSATPIDPDKPVEALVMKEHLGSIIIKEKRETVLEKGRIVPCHYKMISFGMEGSISEASAYDIAYTEWILQNDKFHKLIANMCVKYQDGGTLILVDRRELGNALEKIISDVGLKTSFIHGDTPKRRRSEMLKRFEDRDLNVLIGGKIINRGLDLSGGCETLIMAGGGKLQSDLLQKVGRAFRLNSQGYSRVFDFFFRCNRYLYSHSKQRLKAAVAENFEVKIVFPGGMIDGEELIRKGFRVPKQLYSK